MDTNSTSFSISGIKELSQNLQRLDSDMKSKMLRPAVRAGMSIARDAAIRRAAAIDDPNTPRRIADNIHLKTLWQKKTQSMIAAVGVEGGARYRRGDKQRGKTTHWRFQELGTKRHRAQPFLRPALANNTAAIMQEFIFELQRQMQIRG